MDGMLKNLWAEALAQPADNLLARKPVKLQGSFSGRGSLNIYEVDHRNPRIWKDICEFVGLRKRSIY
jgi:hypothetical protein